MAVDANVVGTKLDGPPLRRSHVALRAQKTGALGARDDPEQSSLDVVAQPKNLVAPRCRFAKERAVATKERAERGYLGFRLGAVEELQQPEELVVVAHARAIDASSGRTIRRR